MEHAGPASAATGRDQGKTRRLGTSPTRADALLRAATGALRARDGGALLDARLFGCADALAACLPSHYLPDVWLEQPLAGGREPCAALALAAHERNYLNHLSAGTYLAAAGIPGELRPEACDIVCGIRAGVAGVEPFALHDGSTDIRDISGAGDVARALGRDAASVPSGAVDLLGSLASGGIGARVLARGDAGRFELTILPDKLDLAASFDRAPCRRALRAALEGAGCAPEALAALDTWHAACRLDGYCVGRGMVECLVTADVRALTFRWEDGRPRGASAGILVTDRVPDGWGAWLKPTSLYQWHITEDCDQRCRHCYLFAEDARRHVASMSWEQLTRTLAEVEGSARAFGTVPEVALTGGDPILHPRFWDLCETLHDHGVRFRVMGNPFHLDEAACLRLRRLGCYHYQMSLDGLEAFHDRQRRPGSFRATLEALGSINAAGIESQLMATVSRQNLGDVLRCMDVAAQHGAAAFVFARYCATSPGRAAESYPTAEEYRAFLYAYHRKRRELERGGCRTRFREKDHLFTLVRHELGEFRVPAWSAADPTRICAGCHLGCGCAIAANGDLLACRRMESKVGSIEADTLWKVDAGEAMAAYRDPSRIARCRDCELVAWCRGCRAVGFNATGDLQAPDPMCWHEPAATRQGEARLEG